MRKAFVLLLTAILALSCSNAPQDLAEKAVRTYLKENSASYESISFSKLDTINLADDVRYNEVRDSLRFYRNALNTTGDQFELAASQNHAKRLKLEREELEQFFQGKKYKISHAYRANDIDGKQREVEADFYLSGSYQIVD